MGAEDSDRSTHLVKSCRLRQFFKPLLVFTPALHDSSSLSPVRQRRHAPTSQYPFRGVPRVEQSGLARIYRAYRALPIGPRLVLPASAVTTAGPSIYSYKGAVVQRPLLGV